MFVWRFHSRQDCHSAKKTKGAAYRWNGWLDHDETRSRTGTPGQERSRELGKEKKQPAAGESGLGFHQSFAPGCLALLESVMIRHGLS